MGAPLQHHANSMHIVGTNIIATACTLSGSHMELEDGSVLRLHEQRPEKELPAAPSADGVGAGASSAEVPSEEGVAPQGELNSTEPPGHTDATVSLRDLLLGIKG